MAISIQTVAYCAVGVAGITLFLIGTPAERGGAASLSVAPPSHAAAPPVASANGISLQSVNVDLPTSDRSFPGGAAAEAVTANCTACHSPGMILEQPALTATQWQAEINHMRVDFKAPVVDEDIPAIVAYLAHLKGASSN